MRFHLAVDFVFVSARLQRSEVFGKEDYYPPRDGNIETFLRAAGKDIKNYQAIFYIACIQDSLPDDGWQLRGRGGAFTIGVGAGKGYGYSWWEATRAHHNAGNNWLTVHEFHHQLDDIFAVSGYPEYWFNHFSPGLGTVADFGEHFDGNAFILRQWPAVQWFDAPRWGAVRVARDKDDDGIPDDAPSVPLDEKRLHSNPDKVDSDDDGVSDLDEVMFSNWVHEGWGETYALPSRFPNLRSPDTDGDGQRDDVDAYPLYPWSPRVARDNDLNHAELLGALHENGLQAQWRATWDSDTLKLRMEMSPLVPPRRDGWFIGRDNLQIRFDPSKARQDSLRWQVELFNAGDCPAPARWPFMDKELVKSVPLRTFEKDAAVEIHVGRRPELGLDFFSGKTLGINLGFLQAMNGVGPDRRAGIASVTLQTALSRYLTAFEPNRLLKIHLE